VNRRVAWAFGATHLTPALESDGLPGTIDISIMEVANPKAGGEKELRGGRPGVPGVERGFSLVELRSFWPSF
jgi:hypothetical protein